MADISHGTGQVRPPWSSEASIRSGCTSCGACIDACPEGILFRGRAGTPVLDFDAGACTFCRKCAEACDEPVFAPAEQAPWTYVAAIGPGCLLYRNVSCQSCTDACDATALRLDYRAGRIGAIAINTDQCTGCGACLGVCPVNAITLSPGRAEEAA